MEFEEEEERTFIPSAVSVSPKPLFRCDKQCSEEALSCWQLASVVLNEGDEAYATNLCQKCFNKHLQARGEKNAVKCAAVTGSGEEGVSWKNVENGGKEPYLRGMWVHFSCERSKAKKFRQLADEEKQAGTHGQWLQESPAKEYLEQVKCCHDTDCNESTMKNGFTALKNGTWEEYEEAFRKKDESLRMGLRQDNRGVRFGSTG